LKWLIVVDVERQIILAQSARQAPWNDCATLPALLGQAHQHTPIGCVLADAEFDSERNHTFCRQQLKANSIIPAKRFTSRRATGVRGQMRENFPRNLYGKRSLIESVFSAVKRKLSCRAPGRTIATQSRQALLLGLAFNLYRLWLPAPRCLRRGEDVNRANQSHKTLDSRIKMHSGDALCVSACADDRTLGVDRRTVGDGGTGAAASAP
jgi:hypothetical protein